MDPLRKYEYDEEALDLTYSYGDQRGTVAFAPEAPSRAHHDDLSREAVAQLQADADVFLAEDEWVLIDGYDG